MNLYKLWNGDLVAAFITANTEKDALTKYRQQGGTLAEKHIETEQISFGYPEDICEIYW